MATIADLLVKVGANVSGFDSAMEGMPAEAAEAASGIESKLGGIDFDKVAVAAGAAGLAAGAALTAGAIEGIERGAVSDKLAAQLDLTAAESEQAGSIAGSLYAGAYGQSFEHVNQAVGAVIGELGDNLDPAGIEDATASALDLAAAFDLDVTEAVTRAGTLIRTGLASDATHALDLITASMQEVAPGLRDELGEATVEYSRFFGDLGFSGEQMFALLAAADDKFALDKTGDAIKEFSIRATDMSALSVAAFDTMGMDAETMANRILAGGDTAQDAFREIVGGLRTIEDPALQANTAIALFGTPIEDLGTGKIPGFLESLIHMGEGLEDVGGRADEMGDVLNDNAATKIEGYKRSIEGMLARVVEAPGILGDMAAGAAGVGMAFSPLMPLLTALAIVFQGQVASMAASAASSTASVVASVARQVAAWAFLGVQALLHAAKVAAAWLIALGPIGLVIAAVIGIVVLIIKNWERVKAWTRAAWSAVVGFVSGAWERIKGAVTSAISTVLGWLRGLPDRMVGALGGLASRVVSFVTRWHPVAILIRVGADKLPQLLGWLRGLPGRFASALGGLASAFFNIGSDAMQSLWDGLKSKAGDILSWAGGFAEDMAGKLNPANWFSTPEEHYRMLFGAAFRSIGEEGRAALSGIERAAELVAAATVPPVPAMPALATGEPTFSGAGQIRPRPQIIHVIAQVDKRTLFDVYREADADHDRFNGGEG